MPLSSLLDLIEVTDGSVASQIIELPSQTSSTWYFAAAGERVHVILKMRYGKQHVWTSTEKSSYPNLFLGMQCKADIEEEMRCPASHDSTQLIRDGDAAGPTVPSEEQSKRKQKNHGTYARSPSVSDREKSHDDADQERTSQIPSLFDAIDGLHKMSKMSHDDTTLLEVASFIVSKYGAG
uniref:Uncharacterized protein n=1 Tax=Odontella aurita TaxID=265563 RepID=A0A7S4IFP4_9STRA